MTVLAISNWFISFYQKRGIKAILIPNLINEKEDNSSFIVNRDNEPVSFIFAGYPQKKDALDMIMLSLINLKNDNYTFTFNV